MENVRVYEIPNCKMVSSQCGMFGDGKLEKFDKWFSSFKRPLFPKDYLFFDHDQGGFIWFYIYSDDIEVPEEFKVIDFSGGLYAVATGIDGEDSSEIIEVIKAFIDGSKGFVEDPSRTYLGNIPTPPGARNALGYNQMDYYVPIRIK